MVKVRNKREGSVKMEKQFYEMPIGDKIALVFMIGYAIATFLFVNSDIKIAGVSIFGWLMGMMMFITPIVHLLCMSLEEKGNKTST
jgi:hypothetical protein